MPAEEIKDGPGAASTLITGATCVDVVIRVDRLPSRGGHCRVLKQKMSLGGCAFNVANTLRLTHAPFCFVTPVGTGIYGEFVEKGLAERSFDIRVRIPEENGCCYCLVEPDGERSFIPFHGGEYTFRKEWMKDICPSDYRFVYVCGIEINEPTGEDIVSWLEETLKPGAEPELFFAPSPHIGEIRSCLTERMLALHPVLHLNEEESLMMSHKADVYEAALSLRERTGNAVIITLGAKGALCLEKEGEPCVIPVEECDAVDTNGAGDAHAGALLSALCRGLSMREAVGYANGIAAKTVTLTGELPGDL